MEVASQADIVKEDQRAVPREREAQHAGDARDERRDEVEREPEDEAGTPIARSASGC